MGPSHPSQPPNVVLFLCDDMGYSDLGCYGGEIDTPHVDALAAGGLRFSQFYSTPRCCPSRASLLTGLHPHQAGVGHMVQDKGFEEYSGRLNDRCVTVAEVLRTRGYRTYLSGKWHVCRKADIRQNVQVAWPRQRGFDHCFSFLAGAASYYWPKAMVRDDEFIDAEIRADPDFYLTDAISENAAGFIQQHHADPETHAAPFFLYVAYTAPHWPLHAKPADIARYEGRFAAGWDMLRDERLARQKEMGLLPPGLVLSDRDPSEPAWAKVKDKAWQQRRMEVYAAQVSAVDRGVGQVVSALQATGTLENTLILFLSDNGACAEVIRDWRRNGPVTSLSGQDQTKDGRPVRYGNDPSIVPGPEDTYASYGRAWANLSNTPFRLYKQWTHEGGLASPFIVHWPAGITARGEVRHHRGHLPDIMATLVAISGASYPTTFHGHAILPMEGRSLGPAFGPAFAGQQPANRPAGPGKPAGTGNSSGPREFPLCFEHQGNAAIIAGDWKLVRDHPYDWELYDLRRDRTELHDRSREDPRRADALATRYQHWAERVGVRAIRELREKQHAGDPRWLRHLKAKIEARFTGRHVKWRKLTKKRRA